MNYEGHLIVGLGSLSAVLLAADAIRLAPIPGTLPLAAGLGITALGSIAPDIDHPRSIISATLPNYLLKFGSRLLLLISIPVFITVASRRKYNFMDPGQLFQQDIFRLLLIITLGAAGLLALSRIVHTLFKHRGPIHSPVFSVGVILVVTLLIAIFIPGWWWMGLTFGWGWLSHLAADSLTPAGIPLLWPLSTTRINLLPDIFLSPARFLAIVLSILSMGLLLARSIRVY